MSEAVAGEHGDFRTIPVEVPQRPLPRALIWIIGSVIPLIAIAIFQRNWLVFVFGPFQAWVVWDNSIRDAKPRTNIWRITPREIQIWRGERLLHNFPLKYLHSIRLNRGRLIFYEGTKFQGKRYRDIRMGALDLVDFSDEVLDALLPISQQWDFEFDYDPARKELAQLKSDLANVEQQSA